MRYALVILIGFGCAASFAQEAAPAVDPFGPAENSTDNADWTETHPDGEIPAARMLTLAHTDALPAFDRAEVYAVSFPDRDSKEGPKTKPGDNTFPVRPYNAYADVHGHITLRGDDCKLLHNSWRSLAFDSLGGAFCHYPAYGIRFYRSDLLLFETTVCWQCQNFYLPIYDAKKRHFSHRWYGFTNDDNSKALLALFRRKLPHPKIQDEAKSGE
ncbi:hypothetical protein SH528x_004697 [Novipirellula sp. SH528]|uniref:hypothetical protein n=1 Tax=Novipirellula sp. SH528 TaxID=3454466 RepID=UPI003FA04DC3